MSAFNGVTRPCVWRGRRDARVRRGAFNQRRVRSALGVIGLRSRATASRPTPTRCSPDLPHRSATQNSNQNSNPETFLNVFKFASGELRK